MNTEKIEQILKEHLDLKEVYVSGENTHYQVIAVGEIFNGLSRVKQQQLIYAPLMEYISSSAIHALSIKVFTPEKWERERMFYLSS
ncbi:BolA family transcriptional regulator [Mergibacter septicus]|uniref:BolA family protein n=1 Tax=Mergibacter septicus TaxID=221402 RepID=UPI00117961B5|nr:BolA family protein [Mergibacter septicus]AWX14494.1 BolA family transcriptional regulator [Mergibacter septicus]QDJ12410.1 BolA family transcriptional regulator [Mergibacter septicus]